MYENWLNALFIVFESLWSRWMQVAIDRSRNVSERPMFSSGQQWAEMMMTDRLPLSRDFDIGIPVARTGQDFYNNVFRQLYYSELVPTRLLEIMRSYYEDAEQRITEINPKRFMYEQTPQYEMGYVIGEIIERYKKMVEDVKRPIEFHSDNVFDTLKRTELIQKLYFEAYHLVNMLHEIEVKYQYSPDLNRDLTPEELDDIAKREQWIEDTERQRILDEKEEEKRLKKLRQMEIKIGTLYKPTHNKTYNKWWPLDYGWEIDWYW